MIEVTANHQQTYAHTVILRDLVDGLLFEDVFGLLTKSTTLQMSSETTLKYGNDSKALYIPVYHSGLNIYRLRDTAVFLKEHDEQHAIDAVTLWDTLVEMNKPLSDELNTERFREGLAVAMEELAKQLEGLTLADHPFIKSEQLASLKDRPFHPLAKEKRGLNKEDYQQYQPEFLKTFSLKTIAIHRDYILKSEYLKEDIVNQALAIDNQDKLTHILGAEGLSSENYMILPVHPWQMTHVLPDMFKEEIASNIIIPLDYEFGAFLPSSSMRSLIDVQQPFQHIKVPFSMQSLGALRLTPTRYLLNGQKAEQLLSQIIQQDKTLKQKVVLCDEKQWLSFINADQDIFQDQIGHLTTQIRSYPEQVTTHSSQLLSMAALAAHDATLYEDILGIEQSQMESYQLEALFDDILDHFMHIIIKFMKHGVLPEVHGQNILIAFKDGHVDQLVLRDHDTVRIFPRWMHENNIEIPEYAISKNSPNTLINEDIETFFTYFQTLAVSVNLYAIVDMMHHVFGLNEHTLMHKVKSSLAREIREMDWTEADKAQVQHILFEKDTWPFKRVLLPLLHQKGSGGGSMPSSIGTIPNPMMRYDQ
ncbi:MAG TPA: staphyloferrin B biosynthesis protein SbnC [Staphylococcus sp.]|nr:staphyloferrin B biosynthesis protein SbnC [Staphylococcus sp.]